MRDNNQLTKLLLDEGFTKDNHPEHVKWNDYYGFEYTRGYQNSLLFETGCGLQVKGSFWNSGIMWFMGVEWSVENGNPVIRCPFNKAGCSKNHELLRDHISLGWLTMCCCHKIKGEYEYEKSIDKASDDIHAHQEKLFKEFSIKKKGRVCRLMCRFDEATQSWQQNYDPINICASHRCNFCSVLEQELSSKKGNVFYDLKITQTDETEGFFNQGNIVTVTKGIRLLDKNCSIDICNIIAKTRIADIEYKVRMQYHSKLFFAKHFGKKFEVEVLNVRAETRVSRDFEQDMEDIRNGITVIHDSDQKAAAKQQKRDNKQKSLEARVRKYRKMMAKIGFDNLDITNQIRIRKLVDRGYIDASELDVVPTLQPTQFSFFKE